MVYRSSQQNDTFIHIDGDVYIAALFPIHRSYNGGCGSINPQDGIERVVAAMFALDSVNDRLEKETGFRLGMLAKDTCYSNDRALEESLQFAQSRFKDESKFTYSDQCYSLLNGAAGNQTRNTVVGVIGPSTSEESMQVATLLKLFKLPQISYAATSPELSDKDVLPFFLRTVPSDYFQIQVIFSIMTRFKWSYFSMIHEDSNYGENGAAVIEENVRDANLCLGLKHRVSKRDSDKHLQILVTEILQRNNTNGETIVVLYVSYDLAIRILRLIGKFGNGDNVRLIGVDAWIGRDIPSDKMVKRAVEGALGVTLMSTTMPSFKDFFKT
ncbi:hypothetical protein FSP39_000269 [Pinctada imbricata]|uniref:Receptor ligand binding region domain-containing protein n=1 Tax=Pinctada imbricata TaxID=66713 RepID=A0AA88Y9G3_PINIB|nr:hypothetical protein FSP39_000269 [Pinctada imbricata]